jgi:hypothetical protein
MDARKQVQHDNIIFVYFSEVSLIKNSSIKEIINSEKKTSIVIKEQSTA